MKRIFAIIITLILLLVPFALSKADDGVTSTQSDSNNNVTVYFFNADGCPHCADEEIFLNKIKEKYPLVIIRDFEVTKNRENADLLKKVGETMDFRVSGVPVTVIGKYNFAGFGSEETTGVKIEEAIKCALEQGCSDMVAGLASSSQSQDDTDKTSSTIPESVHVPIFGEITTSHLSLPIFAVVLGSIDGFNPCAMWVLLFLITLLLGMRNKAKMWVLGITFIVASALVYFVFMSAWLNIILFIGFVVWVRYAIGFLALGAGGYNIKEFFTSKDGACKVTSGEKRQKIFEKLKTTISQKNFLVAIIGIIALAFAVNLVELVCSAGLPVVYTQVLSMSDLSTFGYYGYILLYILFFMLDDIIIFSIAMIALRATGLTTKYTRLSHLLGGVIMIIIGIIMILKPEWLMFG